MRDLLRPVHLFGRDYYWHREPGQPLELLPAAPPPDLPEAAPSELADHLFDLFARALPQPEEKTSA